MVAKSSRSFEDARVFLTVAQEPVLWQGNVFATLIPVALEDGTSADPSQFPESGMVWWMLRAHDRDLAQPGRILSARLEEATRPEAGHWYQVVRDSVAVARSDELNEILVIPSEAISSEKEIVDSSVMLELDHHPTPQVLVRWNGFVYGPFRCRTQRSSLRSAEYTASLATLDETFVVNRVPALQFDSEFSRFVVRVEAVVSLEPCPPKEAGRWFAARYELLTGPGLERWKSADLPTVRLESPEQVVLRLAKSFLVRRRWKELEKLLDELRGNTPPDADDLGALDEYLQQVRRSDELSSKLAKAILDSGELDERLREVEIQRAVLYVEQQSNRLRAEIDQRTEASRSELKRILDELESWRAERDAVLRQQQEELERERTAVRREIEEERSLKVREIEQRRSELERQERDLKGVLEDVARRFRSEREKVLSEVLTVWSLVGDTPPSAVPAPVEEARAIVSSEPPPSFPPITPRAPQVDEEEFFERFRQYVEGRGYLFRELDLKRFHLSLKGSELTILGGVPGTGKTSLPRLYLEALRGEADAEPYRLLEVSVSPAWLDMRDLLGYVNAVDGSFQPSESGLFEFLIKMQEEDRTEGLEAGPGIVVLDEMNLSQVEHYFSGFLHALAHPSDRRRVACFSPEGVRPGERFRPWATLKLSPGLRFVGTVNFDETTRPLSLRLLDRANLIQLRPGRLTDVPLRQPDEVQNPAMGLPISARNLRSWNRPSTGLSPKLGAFVDQMEPFLAALGCALTPRRYRAISDFISSAAPLCTPLEALDFQIAQRVLPQIRGLFRPEAERAARSLQQLLEGSIESYPESTAVLGDLLARHGSPRLDEAADDFS